MEWDPGVQALALTQCQAPGVRVGVSWSPGAQGEPRVDLSGLEVVQLGEEMAQVRVPALSSTILLGSCTRLGDFITSLENSFPEFCCILLVSVTVLLFCLWVWSTHGAAQNLLLGHHIWFQGLNLVGCVQGKYLLSSFSSKFCFFQVTLGFPRPQLTPLC